MPFGQLPEGDLVPVFHTAKAQVLTEPVQIPPTVDWSVPEPIRDAGKAPLLPLILRPVLLKNRRDGVVKAFDQSMPATPDKIPIAKAVPVLGAAQLQVLAEPVQVAAAVG